MDIERAKIWAKAFSKPLKKRKQRKKTPKKRKSVTKKTVVKKTVETAAFSAEQRKTIVRNWSQSQGRAWTILMTMISRPNLIVLSQDMDCKISYLSNIYQNFVKGNAMTPRFILPPHPASQMRIRRKDLPAYEEMGKFVAQRKFNGTHVVIWVYNNSVVLWDRRGIPLTLYKLTEDMKNCFLSLRRDFDKELVLCGELLHTKAKSKITNQQAAVNTIVLFDVIYYGNHLIKETQLERLELLNQLCGNPTEYEPGSFPGATKRAFSVCDVGDSHLWMAEIFKNEFDYHFDACYDEKDGKDLYPEIEGLMLRIKDSKLRHGGNGDVNWLIRCRKKKEGIYPF